MTTIYDQINRGGDNMTAAFSKLSGGGGLLFVAICAWFGPGYVASFSHRKLPPPQAWVAGPDGKAYRVSPVGSGSNSMTGGAASSHAAPTPTPAPAPVPAPALVPKPTPAPPAPVTPPVYLYPVPAPLPVPAPVYRPPVVRPPPPPPAPSFVPRGYSVAPRSPRVVGPASGPVYRPMPMPRGIFGPGFRGPFGGGGFRGGGFGGFGGGRRR